MEDKNSLILILLIFSIVGVVLCCLSPTITTPALEISNTHAVNEISNMRAVKSTTIWDYTSGNHEESNKITVTYDIGSDIDNYGNILTQWVGYDKKGNVIFNETELNPVFGQYEYEDTNGVIDIDKIVKLELNIYKYIPNKNTELYGYLIVNSSYGELLYHGETEDITFAGETNHKVDDTPKETSQKTGRSYPTEDMYYVEEDDNYYWSHDEFGHRIKKPKNAYVPKLGE